MRSLRAAFVLTHAVLMAPDAVAESYLADSAVAIQEHRRFDSRVPLRRPGPADRSWGVIFFPASEPADPKLVHYERLPRCSRSEVRRREIYSTTKGADVFDVLYYSDEDPEQTRQAKAYGGHAKPYRAALLRNDDGHPDFWQHFARFAEVSCLPTRYHFVTRNGRRFIERRSGDAAWEEGSASSDP